VQIVTLEHLLTPVTEKKLFKFSFYCLFVFALRQKGYCMDVIQVLPLKRILPSSL